jgi:CheY-like chemotaxis protein
MGARPGSFVVLSVIDTGTGIAPEIRDKIFEPFFTTKEVGKGTGLGLATVFGIVKQHQGWIQVESEPGRGATFNVFLPVNAQPVTSAPVESPGITRGGAETLLLVEDDASLRGLARTILERHGYTVLAAASGVAAAQLWAAHRDEIALLLTDMVLPEGLSGPELAAKLTAQKPALRVIYCSGYSLDLGAQEVPLREGVNFLQKPFAADQLARSVRAVLDREPAAG